MDVMIDGVRYVPEDTGVVSPRVGDYVEVVNTYRVGYVIECALGEVGKVVGVYPLEEEGFSHLVEIPAVGGPDGHFWYFHPEDLVVIP